MFSKVSVYFSKYFSWFVIVLLLLVVADCCLFLLFSMIVHTFIIFFVFLCLGHDPTDSAD